MKCELAVGHFRTLSSLRALASLLLIGLVAGCGGESPVLGDVRPVGDRPVFSAPQEQLVAQIATGMSRALSSVQHRTTLRDLFQKSSLSEHKVVLSSLVKHAETQDLVAAIEREAGIGKGKLLGIVNNLPPLDVYMMAREHRTSWIPSQPVLVAPHLREQAPLLAYDSKGEAVALHLGEGVLPATALIAIQFGEPKERFARIGVEGSEVIQDRLEQRRSMGSAECDLELDPECGEGGGGGGGGGGGCIYTYYVSEVGTSNLIDNGNPYEGNEIEVHASDGSVLDYARMTEVGPNDTQYPEERIICTSTVLSSINFHVIETDASPNPDDTFSNSDSLYVFGLYTQQLGSSLYFYSRPGPLSNYKIRIKIVRSP